MSVGALARGGGMPLWRRLLIGVLAAAAVAALLAAVPASHSAAASTVAKRFGISSSSVAGGAGIAQPPPPTASAQTITGKAGTPFANLSVTVNQTSDLINETIGVQWSGCTQVVTPATNTAGTGYKCGPTYTTENPTGSFQKNFAGNYLQIFQCWSDPAATDPAPENCEFGAETSPTPNYPAGVGAEYSRIVAKQGDADYATMPGWHDPSTNYIIDPFKAVDGTTVNQQADYNYNPLNPTSGTGFWVNPYYEYTTSNEVDFARINPDGTGSTTFQADTGLEAPGLGCGQATEPTPAGLITPKCWLVIVPRSTAEIESTISGDSFVDSSPLRPQDWANHLAVPLSFLPVGGACAIGGNQRRIAGSELAQNAVNNWQPTLCTVPGHEPYSYTPIADDNARNQLASGAYGTAGMIVTSQPLDPSTVSPAQPVTYAPLTLSGAVIAFNIDRDSGLDGTGHQYSDEVPLTGIPVQTVKLTPRLVAKLLSQSYQGQFRGLGMNASSPPAGYSWLSRNPRNLFSDPDFLQYNPEFAELAASSPSSASQLVVEQPDSDAAALVWKWILADKAARVWLSGAPDNWGMTVNPYYSTNAELNPAGAAFGTPALSAYPANDPFCGPVPSSAPVGTPPQLPPAPCFTNLDPYSLSMQAVAQSVLTTNTGSHLTANPQAPYASEYWAADGQQNYGSALVLAITDSASAARYGDQTALLSRSGDDGASPTFVAPTAASYTSALASMQPSAVATVLQPNPSTTAAGAYPLTMLTYAAIQASGLDAGSLSDYAAFLRYAAGPGQVPGTNFGQLPVGYAPLSKGLSSQTLTAAAALIAPAPASTTTTTTVAPKVTTPVPTGGGGGSSSGGQSGFTATPTATTPVTVAPVTTPTTAPAAVTTTPPTSSLPAKVTLATSKTPKTPASPLRFVPLIALLVGLLAAFAAPLTSPRARAALRRPPSP